MVHSSSILEQDIFSYGGFSNMVSSYQWIGLHKSNISGIREASLDQDLKFESQGISENANQGSIPKFGESWKIKILAQ